MTGETPKPSFETSIEQLQGIVKRLESGDLGLEDALQHFESGVRLSRTCQSHLAAAEQRVELLMKSEAGDSAKLEFQPFASTGSGPGSRGGAGTP